METENLELEDGELVDDDEPIEPFGTYNVLQRPQLHQQPNPQAEQFDITYSDESDVYASSESDSDSDTGYKKAKRPKATFKKRPGPRSMSNDKFKVWCHQVQEESLAEDLVTCGVTRNMFADRQVESYDYTLGRRLDVEEKSSDEEPAPRLTNKRTRNDRKNVKLRLGKRDWHEEDEEDPKGSSRILPNLIVTIESTDDEVASDIAEKLSESKDTLIKRVVEILGKEMAIGFFEKTKKIEEEGGMLIMNGSRRRTAGGIYLFLVKNDDHIPQPKIRDIFYQDRKETAGQKKMSAATRRKQETQELKQFLENGSNKDLPALLTRAELCTKRIAEEARLRRGESRDRSDMDAERTVSNPPPSPVTDDPDHAEQPNSHPVNSRQLQEYGDDFLDVGEEFDMEVF
ncbi:hypothetical protein TKK_0006009 [Trichogramma kaykai]|uniref:Phosphorylated adapter RNA export protein n=1 Tax=Trichogramma kaykai TaxID=54128 RepID=A0ABD2XFR9_9HYME